jgi:hypothetical protein
MSRALYIPTQRLPAVRLNAVAAAQNAPDGWEIEIRPPTRSKRQNALMWAMLTEISDGIPWYGQRLTAEEWKDVFTAALRKEKVVPGINGGFVVLGLRTSRMTKREMKDLIELMLAFCAERDFWFSWEYRPGDVQPDHARDIEGDFARVPDPDRYLE